MLTSTPTPVCPHCNSLNLTFVEHGAGVTVFHCQSCGRATVQRWEVKPATVAKPTMSQEFVFPDWFTGAAQR